MEVGGLFCPEGFGIGKGVLLDFVLGMRRHGRELIRVIVRAFTGWESDHYTHRSCCYGRFSYNSIESCVVICFAGPRDSSSFVTVNTGRRNGSREISDRVKR